MSLADPHALPGLKPERHRVEQNADHPRFRCGLVVGKFAPLHLGHEFVIRTALAQCQRVILLSYARPEIPGCEPERRARWLADLFPSATRLVVTGEHLRRWFPDDSALQELPYDVAPATVHRQFCARVCHRVVGETVDAVFTSETYGPGFARELTRYFRSLVRVYPAVRHVDVDFDRRRFPISGRVIRTDVHAHRRWLSPSVYASFVERVALLGGESSGKTTLARTLAAKYQTVVAEEFGRELWELRSGQLRFTDFTEIARKQRAREDAACTQANRFVFCDTTPLTTLFYCRHDFRRAAPGLPALAQRAYHRTILCAPDFPFNQDGTRRNDQFRQQQHAWYLRELRARNIPFHLASGSLVKRVRSIRSWLDQA